MKYASRSKLLDAYLGLLMTDHDYAGDQMGFPTCHADGKDTNAEQCDQHNKEALRATDLTIEELIAQQSVSDQDATADRITFLEGVLGLLLERDRLPEDLVRQVLYHLVNQDTAKHYVLGLLEQEPAEPEKPGCQSCAGGAWKSAPVYRNPDDQHYHCAHCHKKLHSW